MLSGSGSVDILSFINYFRDNFCNFSYSNIMSDNETEQLGEEEVTEGEELLDGGVEEEQGEDDEEKMQEQQQEEEEVDIL